MQPVISPQQFAHKIFKFYQQHGRKDLPWQQNPTPYRVWVSEIMLQQTQVKTVIPYYLKFMARFKTLEDLANASIDEVLHHWQGLGYYSRARNLHQCAQTLINDYDGKFPQTVAEVETLSGIGRSTAGAILSLSRGVAAPILDGNVKRVLSRVFMVEGWYGQSKVAKQLWHLSETYTPKENTAKFNQAMMDLGASLCSRSKPQCEQCPLNEDCLANIHGKTGELPHKKPKKTIPTKQGFFVLTTNQQGQIQLAKRPPSGIWGGLWCLPEVNNSEQSILIDEFKHTFTHYHLDAKVISPPQNQANSSQVEENSALAWHNISQLNELAFPTPVKKFLFQYFQINQ